MCIISVCSMEYFFVFCKLYLYFFAVYCSIVL
nr:MAG TPA: hypothetical protein [Inoviridae sp.]